MNLEKAVIFDLDETVLARTESLVDFVQWQVTNVLRAKVSAKTDFINRFIELDDNGKLWKDKVYTILIMEFGIQGWNAKDLLRMYELCFCAFCKLKLGVGEAIKELFEGGYKIGLISNGKSPFQERNFEALGLNKYFSSILVSEAVGFRKPEREIFDLSYRELGISPKQAVFVGDNPIADIQGAKNAGLKTIFIPSRVQSECELADCTCTDYAKLPELIGKLLE